LPKGPMGPGSGSQDFGVLGDIDADIPFFDDPSGYEYCDC